MPRKKRLETKTPRFEQAINSLIDIKRAKTVLESDAYDIYEYMTEQGANYLITANDLMRRKTPKVLDHKSRRYSEFEDGLVCSWFKDHLTFEEMEPRMKKMARTDGYGNILPRTTESISTRFYALCNEKTDEVAVFTPEEDDLMRETLKEAKMSDKEIVKRIFATFRLHHLKKVKGFHNKRYLDQIESFMERCIHNSV